ncbi:hypothetical protein [Methanobrevibacter filiformis]|uniref:hypothetical protein n=1 Tax=Methanobrevibacter filiformis TaxID=55758 RepID=UPI0012EE7C6B|nr:hypothetical protein [Methanobrevibacter filiformis]
MNIIPEETEEIMYCTPEKVITLTGVQPRHYNYDTENEEENETKLNELLNDYIITASEMINEYTNNNFIENIPHTISFVCSLIVSNIITRNTVRRDIPFRQKDNWDQELVQVELFTDEIKELLEPFIVSDEEEVATNDITFFAITGEN